MLHLGHCCCSLVWKGLAGILAQARFTQSEAKTHKHRATLPPLRSSRSSLASVQELLGNPQEDPGNWNLSPEWWGNQAGSWGRDSGRVVFKEQSTCGNGEVTVTAHAASSLAGSAQGENSTASPAEEWRVLRFNKVTRQSVSRIRLAPPVGKDLNLKTPEALASCLAFPYLRTMVAAGSAIIEAAGLTSAAIRPVTSAVQSPRALCIGMGGGSLPLFLAHTFPGMQIDVVELDPVVIAAALTAMGFPQSRHNITLQQADAVDYLAAWGVSGTEAAFDLVFLDAFDGDDNVPPQLCTPGSSFVRDLAAALHPEHGTLIMNLHGGTRPKPSLGRLLSGVFGGRPDPGYDPESSAGVAVQQTASCFRDALLLLSGDDTIQGSAFTVSVPRQQNVVLTVTRIPHVELNDGKAPQWLETAASSAARSARYSFETDGLLTRNYFRQ